MYGSSNQIKRDSNIANHSKSISNFNSIKSNPLGLQLSNSNLTKSFNLNNSKSNSKSTSKSNSKSSSTSNSTSNYKSNSNSNSKFNSNSKSNSSFNLQQKSEDSILESKYKITLPNLYECAGNLQNTVIVKLKVKQNENIQLLNLLVDTGSDITAIKYSKLHNPQEINKNTSFQVYGITSTPIHTLGSCTLQLQFNQIEIDHSFFVLDDNTSLTADGVLGNDFFRLHQCQIDYSDYSLKIKGHNIPLQYFRKNTSELEKITLKPRSETVISILITNPEINQGLILQEEVQKGVYLPSALIKVNPNNSMALTTILNTTEETVTIPLIEKSLQPIELQQDLPQIRHISSKKMTDRIQRLKEALRLDHLNAEERESLLQICIEYNSIFQLEGDKLLETSIVEHSIKTISETPIATKTYRYPQVHKNEVHRQIQDMLDQDIISHSTSPWSAPIWVVPKKTDASKKQKWRVVVDYRGLNSVTIHDHYPLPNITDILDQLGNAKYFTCLDCYSGFHSVKIKEEDKHKTAFSSDIGHYQFNRMPFGLKNAPATYQRLMNTVLSGLQGTRCFVYMDDIVIYGFNLEDHNNKLKEVFNRLHCSNLRLQPDKCEFLKKEVVFLGHVITENGVKPNPEKIKSIVNYPIPKNVKEIQAFLGLCNYYRRFIEDFASIAKPLTDLTKKNKPFQWTENQQYSFETLKEKLTVKPILQYPDFNKPFNLSTDASSYAISGILSQGEIPNDLPISFASRILNQAEQNYSTIEKELLAIVWAVKYFRPYLYGKKFVIYTDHKPLIYLFNVKDPGSRLVRWRLKLEEYDYTIKFKPGKHNTNADALSRAILETTDDIPKQCFTIQTQKDESYDKFLKDVSSKLIFNPDVIEINDDILNSNDNIVIPIDETLDIKNNLLFNKIQQMTNHKIELEKTKPAFKNVVSLQFNNKNIYYLVIKKTIFEKTNYSNLFESFVTLKNCLIKENIKLISLPKLELSNELYWPKIRLMLRYIFRGTNIKINIYTQNRITPELKEIPQIIRENHSSPFGGHFGFHKTYHKIKKQYQWSCMKEDIKKFIRECQSCQTNKTLRKKHKEPMIITDISEQAFEKIALDIVGPLTLTENGNKYLLTIHDNLTKFSQAYPIANQEAETVAKVFVNEFICKFGLPKKILTDQGTNFTSNLFSSISKLFKLKHIQTTAYRPESNGALERTHHTLIQYLRHYINDKQTDWDEWIPMAIFAYNTTVHSTTKFTPYELVFGIQPRIPSAITQSPEFYYTYDNYVENLKMKLNRSYDLAKQNIKQSKEINKQYYDKNTSHKTYKIGDLVYLLNESSTPATSKKLRPIYQGPYEIISIDSPVTVTIKIRNKHVKVHTNRIKHAYVPGNLGQ